MCIIDKWVSHLLAKPQPQRINQLPDAPAKSTTFSYVCTRCDVLGDIPANELRLCWCCNSDEDLEER